MRAGCGHVCQRTPDQQGGQALCLAIVVNAIIAWNTVYTGRVLDDLRANGELITTSEIGTSHRSRTSTSTSTATTRSTSRLVPRATGPSEILCDPT